MTTEADIRNLALGFVQLASIARGFTQGEDARRAEIARVRPDASGDDLWPINRLARDLTQMRDESAALLQLCQGILWPEEGI